MRVLSFSYCFPTPADATWGVFVQQRLAAMARHASVEVVRPVPTFPLLSGLRGHLVEPRTTVAALTVHQPRFFYVPGVLKNLDGRLYARGLRAWLRPLIERYRPDVLDAHFVWPDGVGVSLLAGELGLPYVITLRGKIHPCMDSPSQTRQVARALRGAAQVISVDQPMADLAVELGADRRDVHVIPNGVDTERFRPRDRADARRRLGLPLDGPLIVAVAHLKPTKGAGELLRAASMLGPDVKLAIVGGDVDGGRYRRQFRQRVDQLGMAGRVALPGRRPHEEIPLYLNAADVSVLASYREGCPNVVLESLASGTPVVATSVGAVPQIVRPDEDGQIVPPRDADALAEGLRRVLARSWEPNRLAAAPSVQSWDTVARRALAVLAQAAEKGK